jgi:hypothetical protein
VREIRPERVPIGNYLHTLGSVDISKTGIQKQLLTIVRINRNQLIQQAFLSNVNRTYNFKQKQATF